MKKAFLLLLMIAGFCLANAQQPDPYRDKLHAAIANTRDSARVDSYIRLGKYFTQDDNFDSATYYFNKGLDLAKDLDFPQGLCWGYNNLGDMQYKYEHYDKALGLYIKALEIAEKHGLYTSLGSSYGSMAIIFADQGKTDEAISYYFKALDVHKKIADSSRLPVTYIKLGELYNSLKKYDSALKYANEALTICDRVLEGPDQSPLKIRYLKQARRAALDTKAQVLTDKEDYNGALAIYTGLADAVDSLAGVQQKVTYQQELAFVYQRMGKYEKSLEYVNRCFELLKQDSIPYLYNNVYEIQSDDYAGLGMYQQAYDAHKKFKTLSDSILNKDNLTITTEMQTRYETEKKEQEIASLSKEKKDQQLIILISVIAFIIAAALLLFALRSGRLQKKLFTKEKELQKNEMEKKMFELEQTALRAQMNPHFIFNSLNSVQRYIINNDAEGVNQYLSTFANLIRQTLKNSGKQLITLKDEVRYLETYLRLEQMRGNDSFRYAITVNPDIDTEDTYIPNMIIQPFLENSVIHGMAGKRAEEGLINLTISKNHKLTCMVEDNGTGIAASRVLRQQTDEEHESMGTLITEKRISMFNTMNSEKIELEVLDKTEAGGHEKGTRVMLKFPLNINN